MSAEEWFERFAEEIRQAIGPDGMLGYDKIMEAAARAAGVEL